MDLRTALRYAACAGVALVVAGNWPRNRTVAPDALLPILQCEPEQHPTDDAPFTTSVGGIAYTVKPLHTYEIWGLVVSGYDTAVWYDFAHTQWKDKLNVADVCLVFGDNARTGAYQNLSYISEEFACCVEAPTQEDWEAFWPTDLSNNHLLTDNPQLARNLRDVEVGDQVRLKGYLVEYSHNAGFAFTRGTSTVRTDTGVGAFETIWVTELEVLKPGPPSLRWLGWFGAFLLGGASLGGLFLPLRVQ